MILSGFDLFLVFATSFILVGSLTPLMRKFAIKKEIIDKPNSAHKSHKKAVPYLGGVAIMIGVTTVVYLALLLKNSPTNYFLLATFLIAPGILLGLVGLIDDIQNLSPLPRFIAQSSAALFSTIILTLTDSFGNPTSAPIFNFLISMIWIIGICNSINFFDNIDGGAAGTIAISALGTAIIAINTQQILIASFAIVLVGSTIGFLIWNRSPARIYMGDAGSLFLGFMIAILTVRLKPSTDEWIGSYSVPFFLLAAPILDTSIVVTSRILKQKSPFVGGTDHLSHRLIAYGINRKATVFTLWIITSFFASIGVLITLTSFNESFLIATGLLVFISFFILFTKLEK